jgi:hypothetical protein
MKILSIDPGCTESAWLVYDNASVKGIEAFTKQPNEPIVEVLRGKGPHLWCDHLAIEMVASYGMPVGKEVFETVLWIGRFIEAWGGPFTLIYRKDVKLHLCGSVRAKDSNIRQALIDRFGAPGTKGNPGATYGISKDVWSALAVAITYADRAEIETKEKLVTRTVSA